MTKYILILALLALVGWLVYHRLRPYIQTARRIFGTVRDMRAALDGQDTVRTGAHARAQPEKLERCASCDVWLPASRAIRSSSDTIYCSRECLEQRAVENKQTRRA